MKKNLFIGLTLVKILALSTAFTMLIPSVEASNQKNYKKKGKNNQNNNNNNQRQNEETQGSRLTTYPTSYNQFKRATLGTRNHGHFPVFEYLLRHTAPNDSNVHGNTYTVPQPVVEAKSGRLPNSIVIDGDNFLEENRHSVRLDIKPHSNSGGAVLDFQVGNLSYASVVLQPHNNNRSFDVDRIIEALM